MKFENFIVEEKGSILLVQINRPKALNALNTAVLTEFSKLFDELAQNRSVRAVVLTGAGEKAFIAGADIGEMSTLSKSQALEFALRGQAVTRKLEALPVPVIAAVNGFALGGGCEMALGCDFIIASERAVFGQPEVTLGLTTGFGGAVRLAEFVGWPMARDLIYTGRRIKADEALRIGLVNKVVDAARLIPEALELAEQIAANSPVAVKAMKRAMTDIRSKASVADRLEIEANAFSGVFESHDQREGTAAFLEKRKAQFQNG
jgi:enoyl-CoA hydratase